VYRTCKLEQVGQHRIIPYYESFPYCQSRLSVLVRIGQHKKVYYCQFFTVVEFHIEGSDCIYLSKEIFHNTFPMHGNFYIRVLNDNFFSRFNKSLGKEQEVVKRVSSVAAAVAEFVYEKASGPNAQVPNFQADPEMVTELLECYVESARCKAFYAASNNKTPPFAGPVPPYPWSMYVGVDRKPQWHGILTRNLLALLTGQKVAPKQGQDHVPLEECSTPPGQNVVEQVFLRGWDVPSWWSGNKTSCNKSKECGDCYETLSFRRQAISPAFVIKE